MPAPYVRGPRDVPALRDWMLMEWFPGNAFAESAKFHPLGRKASASEAETVMAWNLLTLRDAELWYVDEHMVDLLAASSPELPPTTLWPELVPAEPVLAILGKSLIGVDADMAERPIAVDAIMWGLSELAIAGPSVAMTMYQRLSYDEGLSGDDLARGQLAILEEAGRQRRGSEREIRLHGDLWIPVGRTHWVMGRDWNDSIMIKEGESIDVGTTAHASMAEDRRWLATLWSFATTPKLSTITTDLGHRGDRRRAEREGRPAPTVKVVNLRRVIRPASAVHADSGRHVHVRFPVRGHWRNQAYGPGRAYRRPVYIDTFIKGPPDAPLQGGSTVRRLR